MNTAENGQAARKTRRQWLDACLRWVVLGGIAVGSALAAGRSCNTRLPCRDCAAFAGCRLAKAEAARRHSRR